MKKTGLAALLAVFMAAPAVAENLPYYVSADTGSLRMIDTLFPSPTAFRITAGYRLLPELALEGGYMKIADTTLGTPVGNFTVSQSSWQAFGVYSLPLNPWFDLIGKLGFAANTAKESGTGAFAGADSYFTTQNAMFGLGIQFNPYPEFSMRAQYESYGKSKTSAAATEVDLARFSVGWIYSF